MDMPKAISVNKIGGKNMSKLDEVYELVRYLQERKEGVVLVVSAFTGVTNALLKAMDDLNGTEFDEEATKQAFQPVRQIHEDIINKYFKGPFNEQALSEYESAFEAVCRVLTSRRSASTILAPSQSSYATRDAVTGFGEAMSAYFLMLFLKQQKCESTVVGPVSCDSKQLKNGPISVRRLHQHMQQSLESALNTQGQREGLVRILGGHIAGTPRGIAVDVGRSYTDTTAVNIAIALKNRGETVKATRFWKDVAGVLTANPRDLNDHVNEPIVHRDVSISEGLEMAAAGSQLMQIDALSLAQQNHLDLRLMDIRSPEQNQGTNFSNTEIKTDHAFKAIVSNPHVDTITITVPEMANRKGFGEAIMKTLAENDISLDGFFTEGTSVTFSVPLPQDKADREATRDRLRTAMLNLQEITVDDERYQATDTRWTKDALACLSVIGNELRNTQGILSEITGVLGAYGINIHDVVHGEGQRRITLMIDKKYRKRATQLLHSIFVDGDQTVIDDYTTRRLGRLKELTQTFK